MTRMDFLLIAPELWVLTMTCVILMVDLFLKEVPVTPEKLRLRMLGQNKRKL